MKWWEKTVEYYFVLNHLNTASIAPLDGKEEKAGDAIFAEGSKLILIEFKRDKSALDSERSKFTNFEKAKLDLQNQDSHHLIIYGVIKNNEFTLKAQTYFSSHDYTNMECVLKSGKEKEEFLKYLEAFLTHKKDDPSDGGGPNYGLVAAVNNEGEIIQCKSLEEFLSLAEPNIEQGNDKTMEMNM